MNQAIVTCFAGLALFAVNSSARGLPDDPPVPSDTSSAKQSTPSAGQSAMQRALDDKKFMFALFFRADDDATQAARRTLEAAMPKFADRAMSTAVNITDPQEKAIVKKYDLDRAPMPLMLAIAPNGAVTRSYPLKFNEAQLETAFVSPGMQKCLKALQDRKLAFLCVQNDKTQFNAEAMMGVKGFAADAEHAKSTEIVMVDPADPAEAALLKQFKVDPTTDEAITVLLAPPGTVVATYKGATMQGALKAAVKNAAKGCDPKSGCCAPPTKS